MRLTLNKPPTISTSSTTSGIDSAFYSADAAPRNGQSIRDVSALADELISMENQLRMLANPPSKIAPTSNASSSGISKQIKLLQSRKSNEMVLLSEAAKQRDARSISMEKLQSKISKAELELQKLAEQESALKNKISNHASNSKTVELKSAYTPSKEETKKIAELDTKIAELIQVETTLQQKKNMLQEGDKILKISVRKFADKINLVNAAKERAEKILDRQLTTLKISDAIDYKEIEYGIRESGIAQGVICLSENPAEADKNKLFQGYLELFTSIKTLANGTSQRIYVEEFGGGSAVLFHTMMSLVSFLPSRKYLESLMEGVGATGVASLKKFPVVGEVPPTREKMVAISRIAYPAFQSFLNTVRVDLALIAAVKDSPVNTKIRIDGTKITKAKATQVYHPQYAAVVALIDSDIETLFDGFFIQCLYWHEQFAKKFANAIDVINTHKAGVDDVKSQYQKLLSECVDLAQDIKSVDVELKRIFAESSSLEKERYALCNPSTAPSCEPQSGTASASISPATFLSASLVSIKSKRNADTGIKRQRLIGEMATLLARHQQDSDQYETASQQHLTAAEKLQNTEAALRQLNAQLFSVKKQQLEKIQDQQSMQSERRINAQTLLDKIDGIRKAITANEAKGQAVQQLITVQALNRVLDRHLDQQDHNMIERAKSTGRAGTYQSLGYLLKALVAVYQSAANRFPEVLNASSAKEFASAAARIGMAQDRLCNHEEVVGRGFRATQMRDDAPIKSSATCYTLAWCNETERVLVSHAYPWVAYQ